MKKKKEERTEEDDQFRLFQRSVSQLPRTFASVFVTARQVVITLRLIVSYVTVRMG